MPRPHCLPSPRAAALLLVAAVVGGTPGRGARGDGLGGREARGPAPQQNFSDVHAAEEWVLRAFQEADRAVAEERHADAARLLQRVVDAERRAGARAEAAPYVVPLQGTATYEGAWRVARHRLLAGGDPLLDAYAATYGAAAEALLQQGVAGRDDARLAEAATRFLPLAAGRRAALLLADGALERGDRDEALEVLLALLRAEGPPG